MCLTWIRAKSDALEPSFETCAPILDLFCIVAVPEVLLTLHLFLKQTLKLPSHASGQQPHASKVKLQLCFGFTKRSKKVVAVVRQ